jgi:hypothetical protein
VYVIERHNDSPGPRLYIGSKRFHSTTSKKLAGKKNRKRTTKESDWQTYWSSSTHLHADIEQYGIDSFTREIERVCYSLFELHYYESKLQFDRDVLLKPDEYYNRNILRQLFTPRTTA